MSQQEMDSQSQDSDSEIPAQPYYWSTAPKTNKTGAMPKNEHPSTFEKSIPPYSYQAQDTQAQQREQEPGTRSTRSDKLGQGPQRKQGLSPDGDAFEQGYRPFPTGQKWQQVPWWARPQQNNRGVLRWIILIGLAILFAKPLIVAIGIILGLAAFAVLLPIVIVLVLVGVFSVMALIALSALGVPIRPRKMWGQWRTYRRRRRSWR